MPRYDHQTVEHKWQERWAEAGAFQADDKAKGERAYVLDMFPYPSAAGLHVGHPEGYTATDIYARYLRMKGVEVLHPMGWDAFGLPAENYAIKTGRHPKEVTLENIENFRRQIQSLGFSYDWSREVNTADPSYYKWTQWLFLQLYEKGLAYRKEAPVNWCPKDQTVLANEQVVDGCCERCGSTVEQRQMKQWFFKTTAYADKLLAGLDGLDWPQPIIDMQRNWIGKSEGAEVIFPVRQPGVKRFVLLHGREGSPQTNFFPWLKAQLEKSGYEVEAPVLPHSDNPDVEEQAAYVRKHCTLDEQTVLVGHSFGGVVGLRLLERGVKVNHMVFAATPISGQFLDGKERLSVSQGLSGGFAFDVIRQNAKGFTVLSDTHDSVVPLEDGRSLAASLGVHTTEVLGTDEHFCAEREPAVLAACRAQLSIFTTRLDTIFGATFVVISPEVAQKWLEVGWQASAEVKKYVAKSLEGKELERLERTAKEKTGVDTGIKAINPATKEEVPVWVADYVLGSYGTGAIMAVPAHDERDFVFAKKFGLSIKTVVVPSDTNTVILHGCPDNPEPDFKRTDEAKRWRYWIREHLRAFGLEAATPLMPEPWAPNYEAWKNEFEKNKINERSVLIGHSCSAIFLVRWLNETKCKIAHLVLVAPWKVARTNERDEWYGYGIKPLPDSQVGHITIFTSDTEEPDGKLSAKLFYEALGGNLIDLPNHGHYVLNDMGTNEFPELLATIFNSYSSYIDDGVLVQSGEFSGMDSKTARHKIAKKIGAELKTQYRLRDWLISRQRYWGAPIPIIYCEACGELPVPEKDLPVELPDDVDFRPTGESPLARSESFHNVTCPKCGKPARRESDTMDTFVDSSWYFLRYCDPQNSKAAFDAKKVKHWCPVTLYVGGAEHAVLHLMYARFITKVLQHLGYVNFPEPFLKLKNQGLILGEDGQKMSKSKGNVVNPDEVVAQYGADTLRLYEMFLGPLEDVKPWNTSSIIGLRRFLERVAALAPEMGGSGKPEPELGAWLAKTVKKVTDDINGFHFNTAISALMELTNYLTSIREQQVAGTASVYQALLTLLYPFAPHISCELWEQQKFGGQLWKQEWPSYDAKLLKAERLTLAVQVNGKLRATVEVPAGASEAEVVKLAQAEPAVLKYLGAGSIIKTIYVPSKLVNFVV